MWKNILILGFISLSSSININMIRSWKSTNNILNSINSTNSSRMTLEEFVQWIGFGFQVIN